jgi:hypothetical protein
MTKLNAIKLEDFQNAVKNANKQLVESIKDSEALIKEVYEGNKNYSVQTATSFAIKRLKKAKSDESATDVKGFVIGKKIQGTTGKGPTIFAIMQGKTGIAVKTWRGEVDIGDKKIKFPNNGAVRIRVKMERNDFTDKDEYTVANVIARNPIEKDEILKRLEDAGAIITLNDVRKLIKRTSPEPVVITKVVIGGATASKKFGTDILQPIWFVNESDGKIKSEGPNVSLRTRKSDDTTAWIRIVGVDTEFIQVEDFVDISKESLTRFDDPEDQATYLGYAMEDRTIIVVGGISNISGDNDNGYQMNINAYALFEDIAETTPIVIGQQPLPQEEDEKPIEEAPIVTEETPITEKEKPTEEAPIEVEETKEEINESPKETENQPEKTPEKEEEKKEEESETIEEIKITKTPIKTPQMEEIENKLLFCACIKTGKAKNNSPRSQKIQCLRETSLDDLRMMGAIKKLDAIDAALVTTVYEYLLKE